MSDIFDDSQMAEGGEDTAVNDPDSDGPILDEDNPQVASGGGGIASVDPSNAPEESGGGSGSSGGSGGGRETNYIPDKEFGFEVIGVSKTFNFAPTYYPKRVNITKGIDTDKTAGACKGEDITIKKVNNRRIHITGTYLYEKHNSTFHKMNAMKGRKVELINDILPGGGMECYLNEVEHGNIAGWDPIEADWKIEYTLDFIATGKDEETSNSGGSGIVSEGDGGRQLDPSLEDELSSFGE